MSVGYPTDGVEKSAVEDSTIIASSPFLESICLVGGKRKTTDARESPSIKPMAFGGRDSILIKR